MTLTTITINILRRNEENEGDSIADPQTAQFLIDTFQLAQRLPS